MNRLVERKTALFDAGKTLSGDHRQRELSEIAEKSKFCVGAQQYRVGAVESGAEESSDSKKQAHHPEGPTAEDDPRLIARPLNDVDDTLQKLTGREKALGDKQTLVGLAPPDSGHGEEPSRIDMSLVIPMAPAPTPCSSSSVGAHHDSSSSVGAHHVRGIAYMPSSLRGGSGGGIAPTSDSTLGRLSSHRVSPGAGVGSRQYVPQKDVMVSAHLVDEDEVSVVVDWLRLCRSEAVQGLILPFVLQWLQLQLLRLLPYL